MQQLLGYLNSIDPCIQFTVEEETEGKLLFLDVCLQRKDDGSLTTSVFKKVTHTNQYLSFDLHHPVAHKAAVVRTLMHRASTLSSNSVERVAEKKIMKALRDNGSPPGIIHRHSRTLYQGTRGQEWCIRSPAQVAPKCTLVSLEGPWNTDCLNTNGHYRVGMWLHQPWQSTHGPLATMWTYQRLKSSMSNR